VEARAFVTEHLARRSKVNAEGICFRAVPDSFAAMSSVCGASEKGTNNPLILHHKDTTEEGAPSVAARI